MRSQIVIASKRNVRDQPYALRGGLRSKVTICDLRSAATAPGYEWVRLAWQIDYDYSLDNPYSFAKLSVELINQFKEIIIKQSKTMSNIISAVTARTQLGQISSELGKGTSAFWSTAAGSRPSSL